MIKITDPNKGKTPSNQNHYDHCYHSMESWVIKMPCNWEPGDCPKCIKGQWCKFYSPTELTDPAACLFGGEAIESCDTLKEALSERSHRREKI